MITCLHTAEMIQRCGPWSFKLSSAGWQKNVRTGRERGRRGSLWRESVCQTSSSMYPVAVPQCEPVIGERPSVLPSSPPPLPSFLPSAWLNRCAPLCSSRWSIRSVSQTDSAAASVCVCVLHYVCVVVLLAVRKMDLTRMTCSMASVTPGWILPASCQPLDPYTLCNAAQ